jgi:hypothetical protein
MTSDRGGGPSPPLGVILQCFKLSSSGKERSGEFSAWYRVELQHAHVDGGQPLVAPPCRAKRLGELDACNFDGKHLARWFARLTLLAARELEVRFRPGSEERHLTEYP